MAAEFTQKEDSRPMLSKGAGTPYLAIFNAQQAVIRDPQNNLPLGTFVTHFEYIYEEDKVDHGKIDIETNNPDILGLTELGYQQGLQLQWGWIYPDGTTFCGQVRKVIITGQEGSFTAQGVKISIEFSDSSILLKNAPSNYYDNTKGFVKYVEDLCKGVPIGIALVDYNAKNTIKPAVAEKVVDGGDIYHQYPHGMNTGAEWATMSPMNKLSPREIIQTPTTVCPDAVGVKIWEYNPETRRLVINDPDNFRVVYLEQTELEAGAIVGTSRSKYYQLQDVCRSLSGGPFFMDSRDDQIIIHNCKAGRDILKVYTYAGGQGELLEFKIKSKFVKSSAEVKSSTEVNPDTKSIDTTMVQGVVDPDHGNEDSIDVDTYMMWPNLGTGLWNPGYRTTDLRTKPGSVGAKENSAAWQPVSGGKRQTNLAEDGSPAGSKLEYRTQVETQTSKIEATEETPSVGRSFKNINEAKKFYNDHPHVSQAEIDAYFSQWISDWQSKKTATDPNSMAELAHELDKIPPFKITRHIKIAAEVNLENMGGSMGLKNTRVTSERTEAFKNAVLSGQVDLNSYQGSFYSTPGAEGGLIENSLIMRGTYMKNAQALLQAIPGSSVIDMGSLKNGKGENKLVVFETDITLELNGVDIAAGADTINLGGSLGNDIVEKITNQVKADATVIGDPSIESSMNIQIQNVSSKYSGLWYTKKVTHIIDHGQGYICQIEFVQRTVPISTVTIKSNWSKKDYGKQVLGAIKQTQETEAYKEPSNIEKRVVDKMKERPGSSVIAHPDPKTGKMVYSYKDMVSGDYITRYDGTVDYKNRNVQYLQDLQKQVNDLPEYIIQEQPDLLSEE